MQPVRLLPPFWALLHWCGAAEPHVFAFSTFLCPQTRFIFPLGRRHYRLHLLRYKTARWYVVLQLRTNLQVVLRINCDSSQRRKNQNSHRFTVTNPVINIRKKNDRSLGGAGRFEEGRECSRLQRRLHDALLWPAQRDVVGACGRVNPGSIRQRIVAIARRPGTQMMATKVGHPKAGPASILRAGPGDKDSLGSPGYTSTFHYIGILQKHAQTAHRTTSTPEITRQQQASQAPQHPSCLRAWPRASCA